MKLIPSRMPSPRLLNSVALDAGGRAGSAGPGIESEMKGTSFLGGNGLYWCAGLLAGALCIAGFGWLRTQHEVAAPAVTAAMPVVPLPPVAAPAPVLVQIPAADIRLTSTSLDQPPLAVINGRAVTEGEFVTIQTPLAAAPVKLQVLKIADGEVDLGSGTHIIRARIAPAGAKAK